MNINLKLDRNFTIGINKLLNEGGPELARLNGFDENQLSYTDFIDNFTKESNVADASIDGNANVKVKDICTMLSEMNKPHLKLLTFNKIFYEINKKWGNKTAHDWLESEWKGMFYLHDAPSTSSLPYCYAYDLEELAVKGLYFIPDFNAQPPKHLETWTDFVGEFVSWTSNRTSGACGLPSFLIYSYYFWKKDCENGFYIKSPEYYRDQEFQRIIYKLNQPYLRVAQSAFTNFSIFDENYLVELFGGKQFPDGSYIIDSISEIKEYQKRFMEVLGDVRAKNAMTFPVMTMSLLYKDGKFVDEDFAKWCCKHNMRWGDSNFATFSDVTSLSNCCRLVSDIKKLGYFNNKEKEEKLLDNNIDEKTEEIISMPSKKDGNLGYFSSIGGTALRVGSVKVNTINLARISYTSENQEDYLSIVRNRVQLACKCLDTVRHIIQRNVEKGLLPNYSLELIDMNTQYNTVGIIGVFETLEKFGMVNVDEFGYYSYSDEGLEFAQEIMRTIHSEIQKFRTDNSIEYNINIEQVPAERAAAVLMQKDKIAFPNEKYTLPLYANQWIPLGVKCSIKEKIRISGIMDKACNGGSIAHINIAKPFATFEEAWEMLNYVASHGCQYFAFCYRISVCKNNHSFFGETCPYCGEPKYTTVQRIVGFLVPEKNYSKERKAEYNLRTFFETNGILD